MHPPLYTLDELGQRFGLQDKSVQDSSVQDSSVQGAGVNGTSLNGASLKGTGFSPYATDLKTAWALAPEVLSSSK